MRKDCFLLNRSLFAAMLKKPLKSFFFFFFVVKHGFESSFLPEWNTKKVDFTTQ